jgi:transposase
VSRTAKCRPAVNDSGPTSTNRAVAPSCDERLLLELRELCAQPFEATYKRKLKAVALLLEHRDERQIELRAKASLRTAQRWVRRAREFGMARCAARAARPQS